MPDHIILPVVRYRNSHDRLRVLFVIYGDLSSASTKHAYWFAEQVAARGNEAMLALTGDMEMLQREHVRPQPRLHLSFHRFVGPLLSRSSLEAARAFGPTLIHAWSPQVATMGAARAYWRVTRAPLFVHWEDDDDTMRRGIPGRPPHRILGHRLRRVVGYVLPGLGPRASNAAGLRWIARRATALDALTQALAEEVEVQMARPCAVLLPVTPQQADTGREGPSLPSEIPVAVPGATLVTYTGTIGPSSVEDLTIALAAIATLQRSGRNVAFVHAGVIVPRYDVQRLVRESGVAPGTVAFLGYLPFIQVPSLLARSDVLIQPGAPSRFNRLRLPSKLQAYLASGTPTITFETGFGEMLEDRSEVLKLHSADPAELAQRLAEVMDNPELARALGKGGRAASERLFDRDVNTEALLNHYRSALAPGGAEFVARSAL